jgi:acyl-CoA thioesterase FadM
MSHFNSFVRIPGLVLWQTLAPLPAIDPFETDVLQMRVWPNDIDFNLHLNNARHLSIMDYGRVHLLARGGLLKHILKARWVPVVGAVWITYRRSLPLWAKFRLGTRLVGWDNRWFYMEQTFTGDEGLVAVGWVKGALRGKEGAVPPQTVLDLIRPGIVSPELPEGIEVLNELTREKLQTTASR